MSHSRSRSPLRGEERMMLSSDRPIVTAPTIPTPMQQPRYEFINKNSPAQVSNLLMSGGASITGGSQHVGTTPHGYTTFGDNKNKGSQDMNSTYCMTMTSAGQRIPEAMGSGINNYSIRGEISRAIELSN